VYDELSRRAARFGTALAEVMQEAGVEVQVPVVGTLVGLYFGSDLPRDYVGAQQTDEKAYGRFFHALLDRGVAIAPGAYEVMFPGTTHRDDILDQIVDVASEAATTL
jgi:glutamate-1-semialdehyde 2,1-aminomutase